MGIDKRFLDRQIAAADPADHKSSVRFVVTGALPAYTRVGNVITANANGAFPSPQDGVTPVVGNSLLLESVGSASDVDNGIYTITQFGSGGTPFILTRRTDADADDLVNSGMSFRVEEGTLYAGVEFVLTTANPIVLNTTAIVFEPVVSSSGLATGYLQDGDLGSTLAINTTYLAVNSTSGSYLLPPVVDGGVIELSVYSGVETKLIADGTDIITLTASPSQELALIGVRKYHLLGRDIGGPTKYWYTTTQDEKGGASQFQVNYLLLGALPANTPYGNGETGGTLADAPGALVIDSYSPVAGQTILQLTDTSAQVFIVRDPGGITPFDLGYFDAHVQRTLVGYLGGSEVYVSNGAWAGQKLTRKSGLTACHIRGSAHTYEHALITAAPDVWPGGAYRTEVFGLGSAMSLVVGDLVPFNSQNGAHFALYNNDTTLPADDIEVSGGSGTWEDPAAPGTFAAMITLAPATYYQRSIEWVFSEADTRWRLVPGAAAVTIPTLSFTATLYSAAFNAEADKINRFDGTLLTNVGTLPVGVAGMVVGFYAAGENGSLTLTPQVGDTIDGKTTRVYLDLQNAQYVAFKYNDAENDWAVVEETHLHTYSDTTIAVGERHVIPTGQQMPYVGTLSVVGTLIANGAAVEASPTNPPYTPATPADWSGSPTTVQEALDRIAAALAVEIGTPIP